MTTPRDLLIVTMDAEPSRLVERGDLSLALAGAELIDLVGAQEAGLDGERIVPGPAGAPADPLLRQAAAALVREAPYESVGDWLWRRGRGLSAAYLSALEADGQLVRQRSRRWKVFWTRELALVDTDARHRAANRRRSDEPVLAALMRAIGIRDRGSEGVSDDAVARVLAALDDALAELAAERQRRNRRRDEAAVDNVRRGY
ncbi:GOLPH3/VPS74 family protein [Streptomyces botrytidirepellens]|uniref:GPP34 family phosphoprotein n=1 Tax=Streptomyces botrytidirepellens TaxID=2486417 RepID=A0A3M8SIC4_9ACTN|nr:GPP34 family phosphoprotein [Streptomyces botrytidirepellens]RNF81098.1 GPP34 family phosphoprotein [Streptomyces botrytidirepellens]